MHNLFAWEIIRSNPHLRNNLSCHSTSSRRQARALSLSLSLHEKLQLIFNKYRHEYHFRRKMTSRRLRDVPRSAYSTGSVGTKINCRVRLAQGSRKNLFNSLEIVCSEPQEQGRSSDTAPTPSRNNLSARVLLSTSFLPHSSISRHLHTILALLQCRFLIYERPEREILRSVILHHRYGTNNTCCIGV